MLVAVEKLQQQNPQIKILAISSRINSDNALDILKDFDVILDGTDNFETRYLVNDACVLLGKPLVYGAIYQYEGQVAVWNLANADGTRTPHYRDVFPMWMLLKFLIVQKVVLYQHSQVLSVACRRMK